MIVAGLVLAQTTAPDATTRILLKTSLTCRDWATVANAYVALGEARAVPRLKRPEKGVCDPYENIPFNKALLCRILFVPRRGKPVRSPRLGELPYIPYDSMPEASWPEYPFVQQSGVWFELDDFYLISGASEPTERYVDHCRQAGTFRRKPLPVPTSKQASQALEALLRSPRWAAIRWEPTVEGKPQKLAPHRVLKYLRSQTRF